MSISFHFNIKKYRLALSLVSMLGADLLSQRRAWDPQTTSSC
jgi:hypothetical protein